MAASTTAARLCHRRPEQLPEGHLAAKLDFYLGLGFRAFKVGTGSFSPTAGVRRTAPAEAADFEADKFAFVRSHAGRTCGPARRSHGQHADGEAWDVPTATAVLKAVEPYDLFFFEEPLPYTNPWGYAELCGAPRPGRRRRVALPARPSGASSPTRRLRHRPARRRLHRRPGRIPDRRTCSNARPARSPPMPGAPAGR